MHSYDYLLILAFLALVLLPAPLLGRFYYRIVEGERTWMREISQVVLPHGCPV